MSLSLSSRSLRWSHICNCCACVVPGCISSWCLVTKLCPTLATPWTVVLQAPLSMEFPRQEYWFGLPFPSPRDLPDPVVEPASPALAGRFFTTEPPRKPRVIIADYLIFFFFLPDSVKFHEILLLNTFGGLGPDTSVEVLSCGTGLLWSWCRAWYIVGSE